MEGIDLSGAAGWWLAAGGLLLLLELVVPGAFLMWIGVAALLTGAAALMVPDLPMLIQALMFAVLGGVSVYFGRRFAYSEYAESEDPLLNDRLARLLGETVTVAEPITAGRGRVTVGDSVWPARGPDLPVGTRAKVVGASNGVLVVEPLPAALPSA